MLLRLRFECGRHSLGTTVTERQKSWASLALLWGLLLVLAGLRPLAVPDEGRYGEIGRWMLQSGDWIIPRLDGIPFFHKPPLLHWLNASLMALFGVHTWVVRLGPALHAGLMLVVMYLVLRRLPALPGRDSEHLARRAIWVLGSSLAFLIGGQYVNHDMLVACWIGVAIWAFAMAFLQSSGQTPDPWLARAGFVACGLGVLSKGLIGLVLPGLVLFLWLFQTRQWRKVPRLPWISGVALFVVIAVPWFVLAERRAPGLLAYLFGDQQFNRYTATTFNNGRPWWFYLAGLFLLMFPWTFLVLPQVLTWLRRRSLPGPQGLGPWVSLAWIWLVAIIGFFSVPHSKLIGYALPVMPPLAFLAALGFEQTLARRPHAGRYFGGLLLVALLVAGGVEWAAARYTERRGSADVASALACQMSPGDTVLTAGDFPYDLPFVARLPQAMVVIQDWALQRREAGDNWRRELFEGADFDREAGQVLQGQDTLAQASRLPGQWLVAPRGFEVKNFDLVLEGRAWVLYRSPTTVAGSGLPSCRR